MLQVLQSCNILTKLLHRGSLSVCFSMRKRVEETERGEKDSSQPNIVNLNEQYTNRRECSGNGLPVPLPFQWSLVIYHVQKFHKNLLPYKMFNRETNMGCSYYKHICCNFSCGEYPNYSKMDIFVQFYRFALRFQDTSSETD